MRPLYVSAHCCLSALQPREGGRAPEVHLFLRLADDLTERSSEMNFQSITVEDPEAAKAARDAYMTAARRSRSAMDRALARSFAALAEGRALLDLDATMREAGVHEET